jgi:thioredoxin 1
MITRRTAFVAGLAAVALSVAAARAAPAPTPYTPAAFEAALKAGKPVLVAVHADWCPTCKAQEPILSGLRDDPAFKGLVEFRVDYDAQKDVVKRFGVRMQSTLIVFKGGSEVARSVGDTSEASIKALLAKAV